jgi:hypothetical protein
MDDDGEQHDLTFEDLGAYSRWPFTDGQLFLAMMTAKVKFSPRYAKVFIRTTRLYMLDEDLEIIDLTTDVGMGSNSSTPFSTPQKKHKLDCDDTNEFKYPWVQPRPTQPPHVDVQQQICHKCPGSQGRRTAATCLSR